VSLSETADSVLADHPNASALVQSLVEKYDFAGSSREAAMSKRIEEKEAELRNLREKKAHIESRIGKLEREITDLRDDLHGLSTDERQQVREVVKLCRPDDEGRRELNPDDLTTDHPVVELRASKCGLAPGTFIEEVQDRL